MRTLKRAAIVAALALTGLVSSSGVAGAVTVTDGSGNPVPVGSTGTATSGTVLMDTFIDPSCASMTMSLVVTNAGPSTVAANITGSTWSGCTVHMTPDHTPPWLWSTTGAADAHHPGQIASRIDGIAFTWSGICPFSGNLVDSGATSHVAWDNSGASAAQIQMVDAASLSGNCGTMTLDGTWTLQGAAADWTIS